MRLTQPDVPPYGFSAQLAKGQSFEKRVREYFECDGLYVTRDATENEQRDGIDFWAMDRALGEEDSVEVKTDWTASRTRNVFIETVSVDTSGKPGWCYTSKAKWLVYVLPETSRMLFITFADLRSHMPEILTHPSRRIPNKGYHTEGHIVPLSLFERFIEYEGELP